MHDLIELSNDRMIVTVLSQDTRRFRIFHQFITYSIVHITSILPKPASHLFFSSPPSHSNFARLPIHQVSPLVVVLTPQEEILPLVQMVKLLRRHPKTLVKLKDCEYKIRAPRSFLEYQLPKEEKLTIVVFEIEYEII